MQKNTYFERFLQTAASENLSSAAILNFRRYFGSCSLSAFYKVGVLETSAKFLGKHIRQEFAKLDAIHAIRACMVYVPTRQKYANFSFLRDNLPLNVPRCQRLANYSTYHANVPKGMPFFQHRLPKGMQIFQLFFIRIIFFLYMYLICFTYFVCFKYIANIYFYMNTYFLPNFICHV